jgi:hypothetical protein
VTPQHLDLITKLGLQHKTYNTPREHEGRIRMFYLLLRSADWMHIVHVLAHGRLNSLRLLSTPRNISVQDNIESLTLPFKADCQLKGKCDS